MTDTVTDNPAKSRYELDVGGRIVFGNYRRDGDRLVVFGSKGGAPTNPDWYHNLRANPDTVVQVGAERRRVRARVAGPQERGRLWELVLRTYSGFQSYADRTGREIPLVVLERV